MPHSIYQIQYFCYCIITSPALESGVCILFLVTLEVVIIKVLILP